MLSFAKAVVFVFRIVCHLDRKVKSCSRSHSKDRERSPNAWATTAFCACDSMACNFKTPLRRDRNKRRRKGCRDVLVLALFRKNAWFRLEATGSRSARWRWHFSTETNHKASIISVFVLADSYSSDSRRGRDGRRLRRQSRGRRCVNETHFDCWLCYDISKNIHSHSQSWWGIKKTSLLHHLVKVQTLLVSGISLACAGPWGSPQCCN